MHYNLVFVAGRLAVSPEMAPAAPVVSDPLSRRFDELPGTARLLLTVRTDHPTRVDLLPIAAHVGQIPANARTGDRVIVVGRLQRRFSAQTGRSRIEIVAQHIERRPRDA